MLATSVMPDGLSTVHSHQLLPRDHLLRLIDHPYQASVTTIVAGAGFGKTTLAWQWAAQSPKQVHWISLHQDDNDPLRFVHTLTDGSQQVLPASTRKNLVTEQSAVTLYLDRFLSGVATDTCIVLDNCQVVTEAGCFEILTALVRRLPVTMSLVLISRRQPPLPLSRLRAQGRVREITASDLRFSRAESVAVLDLAGVATSPAVMDQHWKATDGWIAGLKLALLAQGAPGHEGGSQARYLDEYILEEVIEPLAGDLRELVLAAAQLPFLSPELCAIVLGIDTGQEILIRLMRDVPFLTRINASVPRYRFAPVILASLRRLVWNISPDPVQSTRRLRAAAWLLDEGEFAEAAEYALRCGDTGLIEHVFTALCRYHADRSDFGSVIRWLDRLPTGTIRQNVDLLFWWTLARLSQDRTTGAAELVDQVEAQSTAADSMTTGRALLCRGMLALATGDPHDAERRLTWALEHLPHDAIVERLYATTWLGRTAFRRGSDPAATVALGKAAGYAARLPGDEHWTWRVNAPDRANAFALRGDLSSAMTKYRLTLAELPPHHSHVEGLLHCRLFSLNLERNDLQAAKSAVEAADRLANDDLEPWCHELILARARLSLAMGQVDEAERWATGHVRKLHHLPEQTQMMALLAEIWLQRREFSLIRDWLDTGDGSGCPWLRIFGDHSRQLLAIDLELALDNVDLAARMAQTMADEAASTLRWSEFIGASTRWAVALHRLGKFHQSREVLRPAIERGVSGGFVRHFIVPGVDIAWMFADVWAESPDFLETKRRLQRVSEPALPATMLALTRRELEVLHLVAKGKGNQQIADAMFISINTVRNHLVNISQRLEVSSRSAAVARARELGILD